MWMWIGVMDHATDVDGELWMMGNLMMWIDVDHAEVALGGWLQ